MDKKTDKSTQCFFCSEDAQWIAVIGYKNSCWDSFPGWVHLPWVTVVIKYILDLLMVVAVPSHLLGHGSPTPPVSFAPPPFTLIIRRDWWNSVIGVNIVSRDSRSLDDKKRLLVCVHAYVRVFDWICMCVWVYVWMSVWQKREIRETSCWQIH